MPTRIVHCRKTPYEVYIGRACAEFKQSIWHNPFRMGPHLDGNRKEVIAKYRERLLNHTWLLAHLNEIYGKTLACWCKPQACHGDVLVEIADAPKDKCLWCGSPDVYYSFVVPPYLPACFEHRSKIAAISILRDGETSLEDYETAMNEVN